MSDEVPCTWLPVITYGQSDSSTVDEVNGYMIIHSRDRPHQMTLDRNPKTDGLRRATQKADMRCREQQIDTQHSRMPMCVRNTTVRSMLSSMLQTQASCMSLG